MEQNQANLSEQKQISVEPLPGVQVTESDTFKRKKARLAPRKQLMINYLIDSLGNVWLSCEKLGIARNTHYRWLKEDPAYAELVADIPEIVKDFAEASLLNQIKQGVPSSTIFFLKTKARDRGYIEKIEQTVEHKEEHLKLIVVGPNEENKPKGSESQEIPK